MISAAAVDIVADVVGVTLALAAVALLVWFVSSYGGAGTGRSAALITAVAIVMAIGGGLLVYLPDSAGDSASPPTADTVDRDTDPVGENRVEAAPPDDTDAGASPSPTDTSTVAPTVAPPAAPIAPEDTVLEPRGRDDTRPHDDTRTSVDRAPPAEETPPTSRDEAGAGATHEVVEGDNFWRIAETTVSRSSATDVPSSDAVHAYWLDLVEANADQLVQPGNADLIVPGQVLELPPVSAGPAGGLPPAT